MMKCDKCGHENHDNAAICDVCGKLLTKGKVGVTMVYNDTDYEEGKPMWGNARVTASIILNVKDFDKRFVLESESMDTVVLGRRDPTTGTIPAVDLTDCEASKKGVSRQHAFIKRVDHGVITIVDNSSANGTYLNGQKLIPNQPRILRDGDGIRLGHLTLNVIFADSVQPAPSSPTTEASESQATPSKPEASAIRPLPKPAPKSPAKTTRVTEKPTEPTSAQAKPVKPAKPKASKVTTETVPQVSDSSDDNPTADKKTSQ